MWIESKEKIGGLLLYFAGVLTASLKSVIAFDKMLKFTTLTYVSVVIENRTKVRVC